MEVPFALIAAGWARAPELSPVDKAVLLSLASYADKGRRCYPSIDRVMADTGLGRRTIQRAVRALAEAGAISVEAKPGRLNVYQLQEASAPVPLETPVSPVTPVPLETPVPPVTREGRHQRHPTRVTSGTRTVPRNKTSEHDQPNNLTNVDAAGSTVALLEPMFPGMESSLVPPAPVIPPMRPRRKASPAVADLAKPEDPNKPVTDLAVKWWVATVGQGERGEVARLVRAARALHRQDLGIARQGFLLSQCTQALIEHLPAEGVPNALRFRPEEVIGLARELALSLRPAWEDPTMTIRGMAYGKPLLGECALDLLKLQWSKLRKPSLA